QHHTAPQPQSALSQTEIRNRQALLNKVHRFWIEGVLQHSLHGQVLLTLGLEERSQALALPWNISYEANTEPIRPLDAGTRVFDLFQQLGEGRSLLILGEPGAGKTTTLLTLAKDLLAKKHTAQLPSTQRIPAIFNLSSWTGGTIDQWLITELNSKYQIPKSIGKNWVEQQQLLLLLDGLDEVRPDRQDSCAAAINQFHRDYGPELVVCCRMNDYSALEHKLGLQSAVYVRSLTDEQIWQYLNQANTGLTGLRSLLERSSAKKVEQNGQSLFDLARSPLILNIMALTYQGLSASDIPTLRQGENYSHQLFSAYIQRMFQRRDIASPYTQKQTLTWLQALAKNLTRTSQTVFFIERMQINWLNSKWQRGAYILLLLSCFFLIATVIGWHVVTHRVLPLALAIGSILCIQIFGLYRIVPAETLRWSWQKAWKSCLIGLTVGPLIGWALKLTFVYVFSPTYCLSVPGCFQHISLIGITFGTVLGITYGVIRGLSGSRIATVTKPNQGIRQSAKNAILIAVVATIAPLLSSLLFRNSTSTTFWAVSGLSFGLALGGGEACAKHGVLRFVLFCQGRIPWNYARFLDYAAQRIFLQKVGGGYIFIHRLLLEHFASLPPVK
ncbi:MAG: NACHT domain-containing protein, partial [Cyanobacteria bacterium J06576_12]